MVCRRDRLDSHTRGGAGVGVVGWLAFPGCFLLVCVVLGALSSYWLFLLPSKGAVPSVSFSCFAAARLACT